MHEETPTFGLAAKIWWAYFWRAMLSALASGLVIGFILGILGALLHIPIPPLLSGLGGGALGIYVSIWFMQRLMTKGFGKYRLAVVRKENAL